MPTRLVVIGMDCATLRHLVPFAAEGLIPNIKRLMDGGVWGHLMSTVPPVTCPAWPTFYTGKLPQNHGVYSFSDFMAGGYVPGPVKSHSVKAETFFEMADKAGKKACVVNFPLTYPVRKLENGFIVSGFLTPPRADDYFHPPELADALAGKPFMNFLPEEGYVPNSYPDFSRLILSESQKRQRVMLGLAVRRPWDLFMYCYQEVDVINHILWKFLDPGFDDYATREGEEIRSVVREIYSSIDKGVGALYEIFGGEAAYFIASDHGSAPSAMFSFHINKYFEKCGLLKSNLNSVKRMIYKNSGFLKKRFDEKDHPSLATVNWSKTKAWSVTYPSNYAGVFLNVEGKFPFGLVKPGREYEDTLDSVITGLKGLVHEGRKVVHTVLRKDEIYDGRHAGYAPDLTLVLDKDYETPLNFREDLKAGAIFGPNKNRHRISGDHEKEGTYVVSGGPVGRTGRGPDIGIQDMAPTMLYMMGLPVPDDMDGKARLEFVEEPYTKLNPLRFRKAGGYSVAEQDMDGEYDSQIEAQLRGLGYI